MAKKETMKEEKVHKVMSEYKEGTLHSGSKHGPVVTSRKQAIAIAISEGEKAGRKKVHHSPTMDSIDHRKTHCKIEMDNED